MLKLTKIVKEYTHRKILDNVEWFISPTDKLGLIGPNGAGKSTLMKILVKQEEFDSGDIYIAPGTTITYLSQELPAFKKRTLIDEVKNTFPEIVALQEEFNRIEEKMQIEVSNDKLESMVMRYSYIQDELNRLDAQNLNIELYKVIKGLGFSESDFEKPLGDFSGGWQMRIALAKLLLEKPNLLLLDEPTNHLDIEAIEWLETYLRDYQGAVLLVSHDRRFLDRVVNRITELEHEKLFDYPGNYSNFEMLKEKNLESLISAQERQEKEIKRMQVFVERFRASATKSTQAKSREKMIARIERIEIPKDSDSIHFKFPTPPASGKIVLKLKNLKKEFEENKLFDLKKDVWVERGDKIAILGGNGVGKTTLMRIIIGNEAPTTGEVELGHNVIFNYFAQNQSEKLNMNNTVIDEIYDVVPEYTLTQVRSLLGRFLFRNEKAFQEVHTLSGGEKSRLAMAKMLLSSTNLILMDEPTNHLDIPSKEVLIKALQEFPETFIVISHDRDFIARTCNKIFELIDNDIKIYEGNYDFYLEEKQKELNKQIGIEIIKSEKEEATNQLSKGYRLDQKEKQKMLASIEKNIIKIEERIKFLELELADPEIYNNSEMAIKLNTEYNVLKSELEQKYVKWEELAI
ncbi:MAG: ABC-F family ATP-binding cassette domain-containing protein [Candidatus Sericytochromatia bacterium]|nr:ABC-F family ATP-binding cassette domain-containing protein [Candidatus Sericytochromatia bacterium]